MAAGAHVAIAAAIANATKASGVIVEVNAGDFQALLKRAEEPLVVIAQGGVFKKNFQYLMSYKGLAFYTKSETQLVLPSRVEAILAKKIWIPG